MKVTEQSAVALLRAEMVQGPWNLPGLSLERVTVAVGALVMAEPASARIAVHVVSSPTGKRQPRLRANAGQCWLNRRGANLPRTIWVTQD